MLDLLAGAIRIRTLMGVVVHRGDAFDDLRGVFGFQDVHYRSDNQDDPETEYRSAPEHGVPNRKPFQDGSGEKGVGDDDESDCEDT